MIKHKVGGGRRKHLQSFTKSVIKKQMKNGLQPFLQIVIRSRNDKVVEWRTFWGQTWDMGFGEMFKRVLSSSTVSYKTIQMGIRFS